MLNEESYASPQLAVYVATPLWHGGILLGIVTAGEEIRNDIYSSS